METGARDLMYSFSPLGRVGVTDAGLAPIVRGCSKLLPQELMSQKYATVVLLYVCISYPQFLFYEVVSCRPKGVPR